MDVMPLRKGCVRQVGAGVAAVCFVLALGGCAGSTTPLPDVPRSHASTSMSKADQKKAVDDLAKAGQTHEKEAQQQIEQSR